MPSIFTLEGPRLGAIAVPRYARVRSRGEDVQTNLMGVVGAGLGEMSTFAKTGLVLLGTVGLITVVAWGGARHGDRKGRRGMQGHRRRRRRRR